MVVNLELYKEHGNKVVNELLSMNIPAFHHYGAEYRIWIYVDKSIAEKKITNIEDLMKINDYTYHSDGQRGVYLSMDDKNSSKPLSMNNTLIFYYDISNEANKVVKKLLTMGIPAFHHHGAENRIWIYVDKENVGTKLSEENNQSPYKNTQGKDQLIEFMKINGYTYHSDGERSVYPNMAKKNNNKTILKETHIFYYQL